MAAQSSPRKPLSSGGDSESWVKSKSNQLRIADLFLGWLGIPPEQRNLWGAVWDQVPEEHLGDPEIWGWLGSYLVADDGYKIEPPHARAGKPLMMSTALSIWGGVVKQTSETIKKSKSSKHDTKVRAVRALPLILCRAAARCLRARVLISSALTCASACLPPVYCAGVLQVNHHRRHRRGAMVHGDEVQDGAAHLSAQHEGGRGHGRVGKTHPLEHAVRPRARVRLGETPSRRGVTPF